MDSTFSDPKVREFIVANTGADVSRLALQKNPFPDIDYAALLNQVAARSRAETKLPTWFRNSEVVYPSKVSVEQTSSEKTAQYKSELVSGQNLIDLTGGFGVDDFYFAKKFGKVVHCEINAELSGIAAHNFGVLGVKNIECIAGDGTGTLKSANAKFDWIYIDPSRRSNAKGKVFMLKDCLPDVPAMLSDYFLFSDRIMVKTAPILDISAGLLELEHVEAIHIVAIDNEVKELLWLLKRGYSGVVQVIAANCKRDATEMFTTTVTANSAATYGLPKKYLYEPNAAIMKTGAFDEVSARFEIDKLHRHSHLYTSEHLIENFPGRIFLIDEHFAYNKFQMKQFLEKRKANVAIRNFPLTVDALRSKWKIATGGVVYSFFTTDLNDSKIVLLCTKLQP